MLPLRKISLLIMIAVWIMPVIVAGQGYIQQVETSGSVDWTNQKIRCTGIGSPNPNLPSSSGAGAEKAALDNAYSNLIETIQSIHVNSEATVGSMMAVSDIRDMILARPGHVYQELRVVDKRYMSTNDVEVDIEIPLTGYLSDRILPQNFGGAVLLTGGKLYCPCCGQPWPAGKPVPPGVTLIQGNTGSSALETYTGLIIDTRGLHIQPALVPKIVNEDGAEIYGSKYVSRDYAVVIGLAGYENDMDRARMNERVADNPLIIKALEASGPNRTDVVIDNDDALKIHNAAANMNFLHHCKVMFVLD